MNTPDFDSRLRTALCEARSRWHTYTSEGNCWAPLPYYIIMGIFFGLLTSFALSGCLYYLILVFDLTRCHKPRLPSCLRRLVPQQSHSTMESIENGMQNIIPLKQINEPLQHTVGIYTVDYDLDKWEGRINTKLSL